MEIINYMPGYWRVNNGDQIIGWIDLDAGGKYNARKARHDGHKGGISPLVGSYETLELAAASLEAA